MIDNIKIICEEWFFFTPLEEVNFFGNHYYAPTLKKSIDLAPYLLNQDFIISYRGEDIDYDGDNVSLELFKYYDSITLKLSNIAYTDLTQNFFRIFDKEWIGLEGMHTKYKVTVYIDGMKKYQGVLSPLELRYNYPSDVNERDIIDITIYSMEKEFKDYFSEKKLPDLSNLNGENLWKHTWNTQYFGNLDFDSVSITDLLKKAYNLSSYTIKSDSGINGNKPVLSWRMVKHPLIIMPVGNADGPNYIFANGYELIKENLNYNMFDFLKLLCNAMGWVFYFSFQDNDLCFTIRNRISSDNTPSKVRLNWNDVKSYDISFSGYTLPLSVLKMSIVEFTGGDLAFKVSDCSSYGGTHLLKGAADRVFTAAALQREEPDKNCVFYNKMGKITGGDYKIKIFWESHISNKFAGNTDTLDHYRNVKAIRLNEVICNAVVDKNLYFPIQGRMHIKAGDNFFNLRKKHRYFFDSGGADYFISGESESGDFDFIFAGNIGTAMFRAVDTVNQKGIEPYLCPVNGYTDTGGEVKPYCQSDQFDQNIRALLSHDANFVMEVEAAGIYDKPFATAEFFNCEPKFAGDYTILECYPDYVNKSTKLKLRKK